MCRAYHDDEDDAEDGDVGKWVPMSKKSDIFRLYTSSAMVVSPFKHWMWKKGVIFSLATGQSGVKAKMICFITVHGVQVLASETTASQDRGYRSFNYTKEIRNKIPRVSPENMFVGSHPTS